MKNQITLAFILIFLFLAFAGVGNALYTDFTVVRCRNVSGTGQTCYGWDRILDSQTLNGTLSVYNNDDPITKGGWAGTGAPSALYNNETGFIVDTDPYFNSNWSNFSIIETSTDNILCFEINDTVDSCNGGWKWKVDIGVFGTGVAFTCSNDGDGYVYYNGATYTLITGDSLGTHNFCLWYNTTNNVMHAKVDTVTLITNSANALTANRRIAFDSASASGLRYGNIRFWNYTVYGLETSPNSTGGGGGTPSNPSWVYPSVANQHNNTNITINISHSANTNIRYWIYVNNAPYYINVTQTGDNATGGFYHSWTTNFTDGEYNLSASVQNISSGLYSSNITRTFYIDTVSPIITFQANNNFSVDNSTIISPYLKNLSINLTFFDTYLYQLIINITNSTGQSAFNYSNMSITSGQTTYNFSRLIDISSWSIGNYTIKLAVGDSHTAKEWGDKVEVISGLDYIRYKTPEKNDIRIKSDTLPLSKKTTKQKDRYTFEFDYFFAKETYSFFIESINPIQYLPSSKATKSPHFVVLGGDGIKGNWIDFDEFDLSKEDYTVEKIDDYTYKITISSKGKKSFKFKSIGGLNIIEQHYKLRLGSVLNIWVKDSEDGKGLNSTATIGTQSAHTITNASPAVLENITKETISVTLNASGYATASPSITPTQSFHNLTLNITSVNTIKAYFYDEKTNQLIEGETFSLYIETTGFNQLYSTTNNPYTLTGLVSGFYKVKASTANYPEREYLDVNISNTTATNINIYLVNNTYGAQRTFIVQEEDSTKIEDVSVTFYRTINGSKVTVAEENTDFAGQVKLYLDTNYEYLINFSKSGYQERVISIEPSDSSYTITLYFLGTENVSMVAQDIYQLNIKLGAEKAIKQFQLNWSSINTTLSSIMMNVTAVNITTTVKIYNNISTSDTGSMRYVLTPPYNSTGVYTVSVYGKSTEDGQIYYITGATIDIREEYDIFGTETLIMAFLFIGTMAFTGLFLSPEAAIFLTVGGMLIFWLLGFINMALTGIISLIILGIIIVARIRRA